MASNPDLVERLARLLDACGHRVAARAVVPTRTPELTAQLKTWIGDPGVELVLAPAGGTLRRALLPLITRRLIGFTDLRDIDGGCCQDTIVVTIPEETSFETLEMIEARVLHNRRAQRRATTPPPADSTPVPRRGPTTPPPRRGSTTPPPIGEARLRGKTVPPPLPVQSRPTQTTAEFVVSHSRPSEAELDETLSQLRPVRLEPLPLVVSPIVQPPPTTRRRFWVSIGVAVLAGGLVGRVLACRDRATAKPAAVQKQTRLERHPAARHETPD